VADNDVMTGTQVEVKARFDGTWSKGFQIAEIEDEGYRIRRMTDGSVLPTVFNRNEVRRDVS
jgi:hypothetical protein